jgi:hypothetical protein
MADTGIDAVKKLKNLEYAKRYRLKRKLLMQQQTSISSEPQLAEKQLLQKQQNAEYAKQYSKRIPSISNDRSTGSCICRDSSDRTKLEDTTNPTTHGGWRLYVQN